MATLIVGLVCVLLAVTNVILVLERVRLRRFLPKVKGHPGDHYGVSDMELDNDRRRPEHDPRYVELERARIKANLRTQFPKLSDSEINKATQEILEKARLTLARIP